MRAQLVVGLVMAALFASQAPAWAQTPGDDAPVVFGQKMSPRYLINRMTSPAPTPAPEGTGAAGAGPAAAPEEDEGPGPYPKHYLFNRLFSPESLGQAQGAQPAAQPAAPAAPASAPAPAAAAKTP